MLDESTPELRRLFVRRKSASTTTSIGKRIGFDSSAINVGELSGRLISAGFDALY
jgi:hypothetical protein